MREDARPSLGAADRRLVVIAIAIAVLAVVVAVRPLRVHPLVPVGLFNSDAFMPIPMLTPERRCHDHDQRSDSDQPRTHSVPFRSIALTQEISDQWLNNIIQICEFRLTQIR